MMKITSKQVNNPLVLNGVNHLIVKHDQVQNRNLVPCIQVVTVNYTKRPCPREGKLPLMLVVIEIEPKLSSRPGHPRNQAGKRMLEANPLTFVEGIGTV